MADRLLNLKMLKKFDVCVFMDNNLKLVTKEFPNIDIFISHQKFLDDMFVAIESFFARWISFFIDNKVFKPFDSTQSKFCRDFFGFPARKNVSRATGWSFFLIINHFMRFSYGSNYSRNVCTWLKFWWFLHSHFLSITV